MTARLRAGLAAATLAAATLLACGDPVAPAASFANFADTLALYTFNGSPRGAPTAISLLAGRSGTSAVTGDGFVFDVAVDIDEQGRPVLYPVRAIAAPFVGRHRVGLRRTTESFESILRAPTDNYKYDSLAVVAVGEVVLIESADADACVTPFTTGLIYGKMVVDSIHVDTRRVFVRVTGNPNCGFRSLIPGAVPKD